MTIGIYGGSFNPVHLGHLAVAREVQYRCHIDRLYFMPAGDPPHKSGHDLATGPDRLAMLELALSDYRHFMVSSYELELAGPSFSINTIRFFEHTICQGAPLVFLMGLDAYLEIETWREYTALLDHCHLVVTSRPGASRSGFESQSLPELGVDPLIFRSHQCLPSYDRQSGSIFFLEIPGFDVSATDIRTRVRKGIPIDHLCPRSVCRYIEQHQLYSERA
ncbi:nicotinate (nicotinamide) nucleotide adenylyltransferase [bacterium]|nr:nicotinate (nicotinamide) nucleotide adenylyltransferase [bacterium]